MIVVQHSNVKLKNKLIQVIFPHPQYKLRSTSNKLGVLMRSIQNNT